MGRVMNVLLVHQGDTETERLLKWWHQFTEDDCIWLAHGGEKGAFDSIHFPNKIHVLDPKLRTRDHQREKQSYSGVIEAIAPVFECSRFEFIYLCEFDQLPLTPRLEALQIRELEDNNADVMAHFLQRVDGTGHPHYLYHVADSRFSEYWHGISKRFDTATVLSMFGSGSFWRRNAFLSVARAKKDIDCYLELFLPTLVHHLGFRIRPWNAKNHLIAAIPGNEITITRAMEKKCLTVHPIKKLPSRF